MEKSKVSGKKRLTEFIRSDLWILALDIVAVNLGYYLALIIRFYVNNVFRVSVGFYLDYFVQFAPFYTVLSLVVFFVFRLYDGMWRYAGFNDMNRIALANLCTLLIQVAGSMISIRLAPAPGADVNRMPFTYYIIGSVLQFAFMVVIRYSYRIALLERNKIVRRGTDIIPALVIGSGELGRKTVRHLEENTPFRAVAVVGRDSGRSMDGVPIIAMDEIGAKILEKGVRMVFIADRELSREEREKVLKAARGLEFQDLTGYFANQLGYIPLTGLLELVQGPVTILVDGKETRYRNARECLANLTSQYDVIRIEATRIELRKSRPQETVIGESENPDGEDVSFF